MDVTMTFTSNGTRLPATGTAFSPGWQSMFWAAHQKLGWQHDRFLDAGRDDDGRGCPAARQWSRLLRGDRASERGRHFGATDQRPSYRSGLSIRNYRLSTG